MSSLIPWGPTRWDPFKELEEISDRFDRIFGRLPAHRPSGGREALTVADWVPTVDISEDDKAGKGGERQKVPPSGALLRKFRSILQLA